MADKKSNNWWYNPAEQAEKNQKASENIGKSLGDSGPVNSWDKSKAAVVNNKHAPKEYVNTAVLEAVNWLDAKMSVMKNTAIKHDNPMGYVASGQAYRDASSLVGVLKGDDANKLDAVMQILQTADAAGQRPASGNEAGERIRLSAESAKDATHGFRWGPFTGENRRTKEATAVEYAAAGYEDMLLGFDEDVDKLKKAVQAAYLLYNKTGDDKYDNAGATARGLLAKALKATDPGNYKGQMEFYRTILDASQGADAATPDSPYVDTARYAAIREALAGVTKKYKESAGASSKSEGSDSTTWDEAMEKGGQK